MKTADLIKIVKQINVVTKLNKELENDHGRAYQAITEDVTKAKIELFRLLEANLDDFKEYNLDKLFTL